MNKLAVRVVVLVLGTFIVSFIGYDNKPPPGKIEVIGDAGSPNIFTFEKWSFATFEIPNGNIENIKVVAEINTTSLSCVWKELESNIRKKKDYFYVKKFPLATVEVEGATLLSDGSYETMAMLTLKKYSKPVKLNFKVIGENPLTIEGSGEMKRQDWGFTGEGPAEMVPITFTFSQPAE